MKLNDMLYKKFTPRERLALFYESMARKDFAEADRLADTCERKTYKMPDAAYQQNMQYIHLSCLHALLLIEEQTSQAVAALGLLLLANNTANKKLRADAAESYIAAVSAILGTWEAWREFCATAGVDPQSVMRTCWGCIPNFIAKHPLPNSSTPIVADPEAKAEALGLFMRRWCEIQQNAA